MENFNRMKQNYQLLMEEQLKKLTPGASLLLHSCCAPCSSACLQRLKDNFKITVLYYNPNIDDPLEYEKRKAEQIRLLKETGWADFLDCDHDKDAFLNVAKGLEDAPERGKRCYLCYKLRLSYTAKTAKEQGFDYFGTTLTLSPYKNADWLNEIGQNLATRYAVNYLFSDFKKKGGYLQSIQLSKEYNLYRQDYCGCVYSKKERENQNKGL